MSSSSYDADTLAQNSNRSSFGETSTDGNYSPSHNTYSSTKKIELKQGQQQSENIVAKTKRVAKQQWDQTCSSLCRAQKKISGMLPNEGCDLIYWKNPIVSGLVFGTSLSVLITFIFLSSLAATSFWLLAFLVVSGLYKLYCYVMATFAGRIENNIFEATLPADISITQKQADEIAQFIQNNGTSVLKHGRNLFLWQNITNSALFGLVLFASFYIGLSINALTFVLVGLLFSFTVPKIYQVYQVPIDRTAKQVLDQINQTLAKVTSGAQKKAKTT